MDRRIKVILPIALAVIFLIIQPREIYPLVVVYFFPPFGKESVIPTAIALGFHPLHVALTFTTMDAITSLFIIWNFDLACRLWVVGNLIMLTMRRSINMLSRHRWIGRLTYLSIFIFVFVPFQGTGGVSASILGRLLGLRPDYLWLVIVSASLTSSLMISYSIRFALKFLY